MNVRGASASQAIEPVSDGGYDMVERLGQRQVDAIFSAVGEPTSQDAFAPPPALPRRAGSVIPGIGEFVDTYA